MSGETSSPGESRLIIRRSGAGPPAPCSKWKLVTLLHSPQPPAHYHPYQEEHFQVLSGTFRTRIGGAERTYAAGESFTVPANTPTGCTTSVTGRPALVAGSPGAADAGVLETMEPGSGRQTNTGGVPNLLHLGGHSARISHEFAPPARPTPQRILFGIPGADYRLAGYRPRYDRTGKETS